MKHFIHETAIVDKNTKFGENVKIWHWFTFQRMQALVKTVLLGKMYLLIKM